MICFPVINKFVLSLLVLKNGLKNFLNRVNIAYSDLVYISLLLNGDFTNYFC